MRIQYIFISILLSVISLGLFGQEDQNEKKARSNKGKIYAFWGWNRAWYSNSDIHFKGDNYDFTLSDVKAKDRQSKFALDPYFHPARITIPQTMFRIGYFINDKYDISIGAADHMKYVMVQDQDVIINGVINSGSNYDKTYQEENILLNSDFLEFEHTDGLNYVNVELTRNDNLLELFKLPINPNKLKLDFLIGFGVGGLYPRSSVTLLGQDRYDEFHVAGYGFAAKIGLNATFFNHFFLRTELKEGFINMPDIRTTSSKSDKASQHFFFTQFNFDFGYSFWIFKN